MLRVKKTAVVHFDVHLMAILTMMVIPDDDEDDDDDGDGGDNGII